MPASSRLYLDQSISEPLGKTLTVGFPTEAENPPVINTTRVQIDIPTFLFGWHKINIIPTWIHAWDDLARITDHKGIIGDIEIDECIWRYQDIRSNIDLSHQYGSSSYPNTIA